MEHAAHVNGGHGVQIFAAGDNCCAVCAPASLREKEIEMAAARGEPRGSILTWRSRTAHPRPCPYDGGRQHWLLVRHSSDDFGANAGPANGPSGLLGVVLVVVLLLALLDRAPI